MKWNKTFLFFLSDSENSLLMYLFMSILLLVFVSAVLGKNNRTKNADKIYLEFTDAKIIDKQIPLNLIIKKYDVSYEANDIYELIKKLKRKKIKKKKLKQKTEKITNLLQIEEDNSELEATYIDIVYTKILNNRYYPKISIERFEEGVVSVAFTIKKDGSVKDISVYKKSKFKYLNLAALKTIRDSVPFPKLESRDEWKIIIDVEYSLN